ncbi:MAG: hypothetical protein JWQ57_4038, partial [Mucilaginibacter sp.]|nr:hypothetical protein [Mucilaginibacter sp.]
PKECNLTLHFAKIGALKNGRKTIPRIVIVLL